MALLVSNARLALAQRGFGFGVPGKIERCAIPHHKLGP
jgi:hypothetical protein